MVARGNTQGGRGWPPESTMKTKTTIKAERISLVINYAGLQLPVVKNDAGEDVTPLKPISDLFGLGWVRQWKKVTADGFLSRFLGTCIVPMYYAGDQKRPQVCIRLSRVAAFMMSISPDAVRAQGNEAGADYLAEKLTEWADALHDYELLGAAINQNHIKQQESLRRQRVAMAQMIGVKNRTPAAHDRVALGKIIGQMASELGISYQSDLLDGAAA